MQTFSGPQFKQLQQALAGAFPNQEALQELLFFELNQKLEDIPAGKTHPGTILNIIVWAKSQGRLEELIQKACKANPGNPDLSRFVSEQLPPSQAPSQSLQIRKTVPAGLDHPPAERPQLVGREDDIAAILRQWERHRIVTVTGTGGMGKSALARTLYYRLLENRPDWAAEGILYLNLEARNSADAIKSLLVTIGRVEALDRDEAFVAQFAGKRLLILDDLFPALQADESKTLALIEALRDYGGELHLLLTCRESVIDDGNPHDLKPLLDTDAATLFRNTMEEKNYTWGTGDDAALNQLLPRLNGLPLAVELAVAQIIIGHTFAELSKYYDPGARHASHRSDLDYSISLSLQGLDADTLALYALFADLPGGADGALLRGVLNSVGPTSAEILRKRALLRLTQGRYKMLVPLREYAERQYPRNLSFLRDKLESYLRGLAETWGGDNFIKKMEEAVRILNAERPNLHAALDRATLRRDNHYVVFMTISLSRYYCYQSDPEAFTRLKTGSAAAVATGNRHDQANCQRSLGNVYQMRGDYEQATAEYKAALQIFTDINDRLGQANCLLRLGDVYQMRGDYKQATTKYKDALALYKTLDNRRGQANCQRRLGNVYRMRGNYERATAEYKAALQTFTVIDDYLGQADCQLSLGDMEVDKGNFDKAEEHYTVALQISTKINVPNNIALCHLGLGKVCAGRRRYQEAHKYYDDCQKILQAIQNRYNIAELHRYRGLLFAAEQNYPAAIVIMQKSADIFEALGVTQWADKARKYVAQWTEQTKTSP